MEAYLLCRRGDFSEKTRAFKHVWIFDSFAARPSLQYPVLVFEEMTSVEYLLVHLATHLTYHSGQVNYRRRLIDK